jgi:hypothetical protein
MVNLQFDTSQLTIEQWNPQFGYFMNVFAESFCYPNPDNTVVLECDTYINTRVNSFDVIVLRIAKNSDYDISVDKI